MSDAPDRDSRSLFGAAALIAGYAALHALLTPPRKQESRAPFGAGESRSEGSEVQHVRAVEHGRGRQAHWPWHFPLAAWKDILWRTFRQIQDDRLLAISAGVVFYALLALFPTVTALVSLYGLFAQPSSIQEHLSLIAAFTPEQFVAIVSEQIERLVSRGAGELSFGFLLGLGIAVWSANAGMKAIIDALNVVYEEDEKRGFIRLNLISLSMTIGAVLAALVAIGAVVVVPILLVQLGLEGFASRVIDLGRWPGLIVALLLGLSVLYRFGPSRRQARWRWLSVGSLVATVLWIAGSAAFSYYIQNYANYDATYGSLGTGIGLMIWLWISVIAVLFGAELNAEIEHQTAIDSTRGQERPLGERGATMADTIGEPYA
jgi:membrane protein